MAEQLKNMYNPQFFEKLCPVLKQHITGFDCRDFIIRVFNNDWPDLELKARVRHIATVLHSFMPQDFETASKILIELSLACRNSPLPNGNFATIFLAEYVALYGLDNPSASYHALEHITTLVSGEFAIRPFIMRYPELTMRKLLAWSAHHDHHVRRLASEGCRPRLPWAMGLPALKRDPSSVLQILENLKEDPSEFVQRSVANNLNDIAKDHPDIVLETCRKWRTAHPATRWILKHGCRTLLKKAHPEALSFHGFKPDGKGKVSAFALQPKKIKLGGELKFGFEFLSLEKSLANFRLEYEIAFRTASGKTSTKIFKITEKKLQHGTPIRIQRRQSFRDMTTRKHHKGKHVLTIIANGKKMAAAEFLVC
jgi:3-methyladenine DNA glycosylase AlkC